MKDVLKYCMIPLREQFVIMVGIQQMQVLSVGNWAMKVLCLHLRMLDLVKKMEHFGGAMCAVYVMGVEYITAHTIGIVISVFMLMILEQYALVSLPMINLKEYRIRENL